MNCFAAFHSTLTVTVLIFKYTRQHAGARWFRLIITHSSTNEAYLNEEAAT